VLLVRVWPAEGTGTIGQPPKLNGLTLCTARCAFYPACTTLLTVEGDDLVNWIRSAWHYIADRPLV
jgi:hypothetical protein